MDLCRRLRIRPCDGCSPRDCGLNPTGHCPSRLQDRGFEVLHEPTPFIRGANFDQRVDPCLQLFAVGSLPLACDELWESAVAPGNLVAYHRPAISRVLLFFPGDHGSAVCWILSNGLPCVWLCMAALDSIFCDGV